MGIENLFRTTKYKRIISVKGENNKVGKKQNSNVNIFEVPERQKPTARNKTHIFKYSKVFLEQKALIHQLKVHPMYH